MIRPLDMQDLLVLTNALGGGKIALDDLKRVLNTMFENLSSSLGDDGKKARNVLLEAFPDDVRSVFEALLTRKAGRPPKGDRLDKRDQELVWTWGLVGHSFRTKTEFSEFYYNLSGAIARQTESELRLARRLKNSKLVEELESKLDSARRWQWNSPEAVRHKLHKLLRKKIKVE